MLKKLSTLPQHLAPQRLLTRLAGWLAECKCTRFKNWQINHLVKRYGASLDDALSANLEDYPTFNSFFTRQLKPGSRPITPHAAAIACPADGCISQAGVITDHQLIQAKGFYFTLQNLLAGSEKWANTFKNGTFATIYLAPKDYHRVHMPLSGKLLETFFIPGKLFSVNHKTAQSVPNLFARNERLVSIFETEAGPMAIILVGAMLVGSINTVWGSTYISKSVKHQDFADQTITLEKGAEMGHFKMGSTVILLFANNRTALEQLPSLATVKMGQLIGEIKTH